MLKNRDIIITSIQSWDITIGSNIKNIAVELSKHNRVLFVNPAIDRISWIKGKYINETNKTIYEKQQSNLLIAQPKTNLWILQPQSILESVNIIPFGYLHQVLNKKNSYKLGNEIANSISVLGFCDIVHICDSDMFKSFHLKEILNPSLFVYYSRDYLLAVDYWKRHGQKFEPSIMKKADLVLTNSLYLETQAKKYNPNSFFVGQGCDISAYKFHQELKIPSELKAINSPVIGYIGSLNSLRLNINLLEYIARTCADWNIVLVGPEDENFKKSNLHKLANVHFTGSKEESELAEYLNAFDVAINPQLINEVTIGNYPRKIDEYLAMGKPVVATKTEAMAFFSDYVSLALTNEDWVELIERELVNSSESLRLKRVMFASLHTWTNNVKEIGRRIVESEEKLKRQILFAKV